MQLSVTLIVAAPGSRLVQMRPAAWASVLNLVQLPDISVRHLPRALILSHRLTLRAYFSLDFIIFFSSKRIPVCGSTGCLLSGNKQPQVWFKRSWAHNDGVQWSCSSSSLLSGVTWGLYRNAVTLHAAGAHMKTTWCTRPWEDFHILVTLTVPMKPLTLNRQH